MSTVWVTISPATTVSVSTPPRVARPSWSQRAAWPARTSRCRSARATAPESVRATRVPFEAVRRRRRRAPQNTVGASVCAHASSCPAGAQALAARVTNRKVVNSPSDGTRTVVVSPGRRSSGSRTPRVVVHGPLRRQPAQIDEGELVGHAERTGSPSIGSICTGCMTAPARTATGAARGRCRRDRSCRTRRRSGSSPKSPP